MGLAITMANPVFLTVISTRMVKVLMSFDHSYYAPVKSFIHFVTCPSEVGQSLCL